MRLSNGSPSIPPLEIVAPSVLLACAREIGRLRKEAMDKYRKPGNDRGAQNTDLDYYGTVGEVVWYHAMESHGLQPKDYTILADRPVSRPDFRYRTLWWDIITCRPGHRFVNITPEKQENPKRRPDGYLCCLFTASDRFQVAMVSSHEVDYWKQTTIHTRCYGTERRYLTPITSLKDFDSMAIEWTRIIRGSN